MTRAAKTILLVSFMGLMVSMGLWAAGQGEQGPPTVRTLLEGEAYISPSSSPGIQDSIEIPIEAEAVGARRVIVAYRLTVLNSDGRVVWLEEQVDATPEPGFFARLFTNLGFRQPRTTVDIPESTVWDGTHKINGPDAHPDDGKPVPEGAYTYVLEVMDNEGETVQTDPQVIVVDNTPPSATVAVEHAIFSPNGDGLRDTLRVSQQSSTEDLWVGSVLSEDGEEVFSVQWEGQVPNVIVWQGQNPEGESLPDGVYVYTLTSTDRAGNTLTLRDAEVTIDTRAPELQMTLDVDAFSPNGDGVQDAVRIRFVDPDTEGISSASVSVRGEDGALLRRFSEVSLTEPIEFDGRDSGGTMLPEGEYQIEARARYTNGTVSDADPKVVTLDVSPPVGSIDAEFEIFSPNGDGLNDTVTVTHTVEQEARWQGIVRDGRGQLLATIPWGSSVAETVEWDGVLPDAEEPVDGVYEYQLSGIDAAGNESITNVITVTVDTREVDASLAVEHTYFSPNGDGQRDLLSITPQIALSTGVERYRFSILPTRGEPVRTFEGTGTPPGRWLWDGTTDDGRQAAEGGYRGELFLEYRKGDQVTATTGSFFIDRTIPEVSLSFDAGHFSPNDDGVKERVSLTSQITPTTNLVSSVFTLAGPRGNEVNRQEGYTGTSFSWDGRGAGGAVVADGTYTARIAVVHRNGTTATGEARVVLDTQAPQISVQVEPTTLVLTAASDPGRVVIRQSSSAEELWTAELYAAETGDAVLTRTWEGRVETIQWDGRGPEGEYVPSGQYRYRVTGVDLAGNTTVMEGPVIDVIRQSTLTLAFEGDGLSPNGDGEFETVDLVIESMEAAEFGNWTVQIRGASGIVRRLQGESLSTPHRVTWDGRTEQGAPVPEGEYTAEVSAVFQSGSMSAETEGSALVDVTPPEVRLTLDGLPFSPDGAGHNDELRFRLEADDLSGIARWTAQVVDDQGRVWVRQTGTELPVSGSWEGETAGVRVFESAARLEGRYEVVDALGNRTGGARPIQIGIMVDMVDGRRQIRVPNIVFEAYTTNYTTWSAAVVAQNLETLDRVADMLKTFPEYGVELDGHAVSVLFYDEELSAREHRFVLLPLSENRAKTIRQALVERGIDADRITVNWFGGGDPIVPFSDLEGRWINRRVEFYIVR